MESPRLASTTSRLVMQGIAKTFGSTNALRDVDLEVLPGEVHAIVGENGAGKSTLMQILSGAIKPDRGQMFLDGKNYAPRHPRQAREVGIGMIYQELSIVPDLTVEENIMLGNEPMCGPVIRKSLLRQRALKALAHFQHPDLQPNHLAGSLSLAVKQLVEIARALASGCRLLIFDEPTSSLGKEEISQLFRVIRGLKAQGVSILYISHHLEEIHAISDRITILRDGASVATLTTSQSNDDQIIGHMVGRAIDDLYPQKKSNRQSKILCAESIRTHHHAGCTSFELHRGEVLGIAGLIGSGRTELLRCLFGLAKPHSGNITLDGKVIDPCHRIGWQHGIGYLSENRKEEGLALDLPISENLTLSHLHAYSRCGVLSPRSQAKGTQHWIKQLKIKCASHNQTTRNLSGGNQQKIAFARLLDHGVEIFLLDEPTRGIDISAKASMYEIIRTLVDDAEKPRAVLMVSSYLPELFALCDRIAVMHDGQLSSTVEIASTDAHEVMRIATGSQPDFLAHTRA
ncbi:MAG: sugar ABC transporter ATP-binding protein [Verrucomicrobia bacterium]|nr:MAG: sugar ABC transporter ATP-binding protein [Verrucomicrobiota bacterium]